MILAEDIKQVPYQSLGKHIIDIIFKFLIAKLKSCFVFCIISGGVIGFFNFFFDI